MLGHRLVSSCTPKHTHARARALTPACGLAHSLTYTVKRVLSTAHILRTRTRTHARTYAHTHTQTFYIHARFHMHSTHTYRTHARAHTRNATFYARTHRLPPPPPHTHTTYPDGVNRLSQVDEEFVRRDRVVRQDGAMHAIRLLLSLYLPPCHTHTHLSLIHI